MERGVGCGLITIPYTGSIHLKGVPFSVHSSLTEWGFSLCRTELFEKAVCKQASFLRTSTATPRRRKRSLGVKQENRRKLSRLSESARFDRSMRNDVKQKNGPGEYSSEFLVGRASEFSKC